MGTPTDLVQLPWQVMAHLTDVTLQELSLRELGDHSKVLQPRGRRVWRPGLVNKEGRGKAGCMPQAAPGTP